MIHTLQAIDQQLFLFLNGLHAPFLDPVMFYGSKSLLWLPLDLFFLYLVVRKYQWQTLLVLVFAAVMITFSDQLCNLSKDFFQRLRPSHEPGLAVHLVNGYTGGTYGFYSAHASNSFAVALFVILILEKSFRCFALPVLCWAFFMAYTRIYLGVHYPSDILAGMVAGTLIGFLCGKGFLMVSEKFSNRSVTG